MIVKKNVQSSNLEFKKQEVNIDTVFTRFNERKWIEDGEHIGWVYDEMWETIPEFAERISSENEMLSKENKVLADKTEGLKQGLFELTMLTLRGGD